METNIKERVSDLEAILGSFMAQTEKAIIELKRDTQILKIEMKDFKDEMLEFKDEMKEFKDEMKDFKDEMLEFKDEMKDFKNEMLEFKDEMKDFKNEMLEFKDEMKDFKDEMKGFKSEMNKKWGELSNKMGTLVEDIVAPNMPKIAIETFDCKQIDDFAIRRRVINKIDASKHREFDLIVICPDMIIVNETKSRAEIAYVDLFIKSLNDLHEYFPESKEKKVIPTFASLFIPDNVLKYLTKKKIYAISLSGDTMEVLNLKEIKQKNGLKKSK